MSDISYQNQDSVDTAEDGQRAEHVEVGLMDSDKTSTQDNATADHADDDPKPEFDQLREFYAP